MYLLVPILFIVTISLYIYLKRKIKGHDFRLVNRIRPYVQFLLLMSIELAIPCVLYIAYCILSNFVNEATLFGIIPSIAIAFMILAFICIPIKVNHNTPSSNNSFAIYLRSFRSDSINTGPNVKSISSLINNLYPIYEIGNPHEVLTIFRKHITIYKTDEDWQESVTELKNNAKIIILRLDGTEGLSWEINSIKKHLNKVLFIAYDETSYNEFMLMLNRNKIEEYTPFPVINNFPSIIWKHNNYWYSCDATKPMYYISQHPWQDKSVNHITNSMVLWSNHFTGDKTYLINRFPTFLKGNRDIDMKFPLWSRILFSIFPFNQQFHSIVFFSNSIISILVNLYLYGSALAYYMSLFLLAYTISPDRGGFSMNNQNLKFSALIFICTLPIYILSLINGPKSLWLSNSFLSQKEFLNKIKRNFIIGLIIAILTIGIGFISKYRHNLAQEKYKKELLEIMPDYEIRREKHYCKEHIDSIFNDLVATYALTDKTFLERYTEEKGTFIIRLELDYQKAIKDSIGSGEYYPNHRDSLKTDQWYKNVATIVISQRFKE